MMAELQKHLDLLRKKEKFRIQCSMKIFSPAEIEVLEKIGHWLQGLSSGTLNPLTPKQEEFIKVVQNLKLPETLEERAWFKYQGRMRLEAEPNNTLNTHYELDDDTFYSRDMVKRLRSTMSSVTWKNHNG